MKTNRLLAGMLLIGGLFTINGQTTIQTANLTSFGYGAPVNGVNCTFYGAGAGAGSTGQYNTFIGKNAGTVNSTGTKNVYIGYNAGNTATGSDNIYIGNQTGSGTATNTGQSNIYLGSSSGFAATGSNNAFFGRSSGFAATGNYNTSLGNYSGYGANGGYNVFLGTSAGYGAQGDNKLYIENSSNITTPLIWGDFTNDLIKLNAQVGIGGVTTFPTTVGGVNTSAYKLFVQGGVLATEVRVATNWADYVFEDNYALPSLDEVERFIDENGHLPNVPSAKQVAEEGISVGEMAKIQQEKIEELTLYIIAQDKQLKEQQLKHDKEINDLKVLVQGLIEKK